MDGALHTDPVVHTQTPPAMPANWYMLAGCTELRAGRLLVRDLNGQDYVLFRSAKTGQVTVFEAHCAHMGCHLKHATPDGDGIRCALHNRLIAADGAFLGPDGAPSPTLRQRIVPVQEHLGGIFVWIGAATRTEGDLPPLLSPRLMQSGLAMGRFVGSFRMRQPWYALVANGFDMEHLHSVHRRALREEVEIEDRGPHFSIAYLSRVTGTALSDRVMKWLSGDHIRAKMTALNGSLMLVESEVGRPSFFYLSMGPDHAGGTVIRALVGSGGDLSRPLDALRLRVTSWLFRRFFASDQQIFDGLDWHPPDPVLTKTDGDTQRMYRYFCRQRGIDD